MRAIDAEVGARVRAARVERGWGLRAFAERVGMSPSALSEFERGRSMPATSRLQVINSELDLPAPQPIGTGPAFHDWREYEPFALDPVRQAGLEVFVRFGYHGATVRMIAAHAGLSVAGFYYYVQGKQQLLDFLQQYALGELLARARAADAAGDSPRQRLAHLTEAVVAFSIFRQDWTLLNSHEIYSLDPEAQSRQIHSRLEVRGLVEAAVLDCRQPGAAGGVPAGPTARAIVTMCVAIADWYDPATSPPPQQIIHDYVALAHAMAAS